MAKKAENPGELLKLIETEWEKRKDEYQKRIVALKHVEDTTPSGSRKFFDSITRFILQETVFRVNVDLSLLRMLVRMDRRISRLESERGKKKEEVEMLKEVHNFLNHIKTQRAEMEKTGSEMFG